ncbi:hypothetical protein H2O64_04645 [Kordia sp. YSTF-M3]|uniref:DUF4105 domain-containing protein n=1 Tax=Kordia aestuariivivens TaxID=2759037 RepID=A0ABR7Q5W8_9FLAO|nr:hypothetical protein [Kordia aestuariivivens]MBC8753947.1 hypothetical protein [Kordia aestuariivivens]
MKTKMKNYLKFTLVFGISFLLFNCQSDTNLDEIITSETGNNIAFKSGRLQNLEKLTSYVEELKRNLKGTSINKESSLEDTYNFVIIEDQDILIYEEQTKTTYTIPILKFQQEVGTFSNLVVKFSDTNQTEAFIINYEPNDGFLEAAENYDQTPFSGSITKESLQYDGSLDNLSENANPNCTTITIKYCNWSEGNLEGTPHLAGANCTTRFMFDVSYEVCSDFPELVDPPSSSTSDSPDSATTSTSSGTSNNSNNNPVTIPTVPIVEDTLDIDGISFDMNNWLNQNLAVKLELISILAENPEAEDSILEAINALMADDQLTLRQYRYSQGEFEAPDVPILDIRDYLNCFDLSQSAEITVYVDQPEPNTDNPWVLGGEIKAGHSFIGITQGNVTRAIGLYPAGSADPLAPNDPHQFGNDESNEFHVSITFSISGAALTQVVNNANNYDQNYDLNTNNCTDYVIQTVQLMGITLPDPQRSWTGGGGSNPGAFGQALRNMALSPGMTRNTNNGGADSENANANSGDCN